MRALRALAEVVSRVCAIIAGCCLLTVVALIVLNIILRRPPFYFPIAGVHEVSAFLNAALIGLALPLTQLKNKNIGVEFLKANLSGAAAAVLRRAIALASMAVCLLIGWRTAVYGVSLWHRGEVSMVLSIPFYPFIFVVSLCFLLLAFVLFTDFLGAGDRVSR